MKRKPKYTVILVAAIIAVLLTSTAIALGYSTLMSYLQNSTIQPLEGTEELILTDFHENTSATQTSSPVNFEIEEAIFDGQTVIVQLVVTPVNLEETALLNTLVQDTPESMYIYETHQHPDGSTSLNVLGRKDGKQLISYSFALDQATSTSDYVFEQETIEAAELENGSVRIWLEGSISGTVPDTIDLSILGKFDFYNNTNKDDWNGYPYSYVKSIQLKKPADDSTAILVPVGESNTERFDILGATLVYNPIHGHIYIDYIYLPDKQSEPMGIDFRVYDSDDNLIATGSGSSVFVERRDDGYEAYHRVIDIQSYESFPETVYLEAKVIGQERTLGKLEFRVQEAVLEATPAPIAANDEETITGLVMKPTTGSWMGEHVCILEGVVGTGRKITISYTYSGDRFEGAMLEVSFKDTTGAPVGEIITSNGTVYADSYTLESIIDGNGWPSKMTIEFTLNGNTIDSFECELHPIN